MDYYQKEIRGRIVPKRRKTDPMLPTRAPAGLIERSAPRMAQKSDGWLQWWSDVPNRVRANPTPFLLAGAGLMIGGFAIVRVRGRQRRRSILMRDFSSVAKDISPRGRGVEASRQGVRVKREAIAGTLKSATSEQASTEEIFRDQAGMDESNEPSAMAGSAPQRGSQMTMNRDVDIRMGEEQVRFADERRRADQRRKISDRRKW